MSFRLEQNNLLHYGWQHVWCNPGNVYLKEYVKGPFTATPIICSYPLLTYYQKYSEAGPLVLNRGIPDPWAEYLTQIYGSINEPMLKDVDIVGTLRKDYRLYIGQGIPDPWSANPCSGNFHTSFNEDLNEDIIKCSQQCSKNKDMSNEGSCLCCKKAFLFECPDKNEANSMGDKTRFNCSCQDCHGKNQISNEFVENCKCIQTLQNWVLEKINILREKGQVDLGKKEPTETGLSSVESSKTERTSSNCCVSLQDQVINLKNTLAKENLNIHDRCRKTRGNGYLSDSETNSKEISQEKQIEICLCSFLRNINDKEEILQNKGNYHFDPKNSDQEKSHTTSTSKEIQTDLSFFVQENKSVKKPDFSKSQQKCQCIGKCPHCNKYKCKAPDFNFKSEAISKLRRSHCPYFYTNYFTPEKIHQLYCQELIRRRNKKLGERQNLVESLNQCQSERERVEIKCGRDDEYIKSDNSFENIYNRHSSRSPLKDQKYLTDKKPKECQKEYSSGILPNKFVCNLMHSYKVPNFKNISEERSLNKTKPYSNHDQLSSKGNNIPKSTKKYLEPFRVNSKYLSLNQNEGFYERPFWSDYDKTWATYKTNREKEVPTTIKFINEMAESDESRTYGLVRNCQESRNIRKCKRILASKRRRKLVERKSSILNKLTRAHCNLANIQPFKISEDSDMNHLKSRPHPKKVSFDFYDKKPCGMTTLSSRNCFKYLNEENNYPAENPNSFSCRVKQTKQDDSHKKLVNLNSTVSPVKRHRQKLEFSSEVERVSHNSDTTWSSNTLKSIVEDLLDKPSLNLEIKD